MNDSSTRLRTCEQCGWVHVGVTREYAEDTVRVFNEYFTGLSKQKQDDYYGGQLTRITSYERCFNCGGDWKRFRDAVPGDCPDGCTIQPILMEDAS